MKADIITAGKSVDNLANEYQALINPIENEADKKLEVIDTAIAEAEMQAQIKAKEKLDLRVKMLLESGIAFTGQWYAIGDIAVGIQMIQEMDDSSYEDLLSKVKTQNEANIAEQKRKDEEAEKERQAQIFSNLTKPTHYSRLYAKTNDIGLFCKTHLFKRLCNELTN